MAFVSKLRKRIAELEAEVDRLTAELRQARSPKPPVQQRPAQRPASKGRN